MRRVTIESLNRLVEVKAELWYEHGVSLKARSIHANGLVSSGILSDGRYFYRVYGVDGLDSFAFGA